MNSGIVRVIWWTLGAFAALFAGVALYDAWSDGEPLAAVSRYVESLSALVAVADDLIVRIAGVAILIAGVIGYIYYLVQGLSKSRKLKWSKELFKIAGVGAAMGLGGVAFLSSYVLDEKDQAAEALLAGLPVASTKTLARWVQVVPTKDSRCVLHVGGEIKKDGGETKACPAEFSVRAVLASGDRCSDVSIKYAGSGWAPMVKRSFEFQIGFLGFRTIRVCEKRISIGADRRIIKFSDKKRIEVSGGWGTYQSDGPSRIIILGDTGCRDRLNDDTQDSQTCDGKNWPFKQIAAASAGDDPDLILHVGDYMYIDVDDWSAWQAAFFEPAEPLLEAAPWVMVRGNHEQCGQHGQAPHGYYLFFGLGDVKACKEDDDLDATYALDLSQGHRLIVADSATAYQPDVQNALTAPIGGEGVSSEIKNVFGHIGLWAKEQEAKTVWLTTHVPVFALEKCEELKKDSTKCRKEPGKKFAADSPESSAMMYAAWRTARVEKINTIISGDRHLFQLVNPPGEPFQVTVGTGGVNLDPAPFTQERDDFCLSADLSAENDMSLLDDADVSETLKSWKHCSNESWGYAVAERNGRNGRKYEFRFKPVTP